MAASSRLTFKGLGFANDRIGNFINFDDVSVSAVPEPAMSDLWLLGVGAIGFVAKVRARPVAAS